MVMLIKKLQASEMADGKTKLARLFNEVNQPKPVAEQEIYFRRAKSKTLIQEGNN